MSHSAPGGHTKIPSQQILQDEESPAADEPPPAGDEDSPADEEEMVSTELSPIEDPMAAHVAAGGIVSTYHNAEQRRQRLERKQAADFINHVRHEVTASRKDL
eukprot:SAG11_NODE_11464_length_759_cov_0.950000_1_plen_102_part_01